MESTDEEVTKSVTKSSSPSLLKLVKKKKAKKDKLKESFSKIRRDADKDIDEAGKEEEEVGKVKSKTKIKKKWFAKTWSFGGKTRGETFRLSHFRYLNACEISSRTNEFFLSLSLRLRISVRMEAEEEFPVARRLSKASSAQPRIFSFRIWELIFEMIKRTELYLSNGDSPG